ncbi:MAG: hypothetical protein L3J56_11455 [Bacteroidales bacterium]|nr:hypothetical protein [Bacteroidales bacterium]
MSLKKLIYLLLLLSVNFSFGQDTLRIKEKKVLVKTSPFLLLGGDYITYSVGIPLGIEIKINKKLNFYQGFTYIMPAIKDNVNSIIYFRKREDKINGIRTDSELKRYFKSNTYKGFYLSTHFLYQYTDVSTVTGGYQRTYRNLFALHEKIGWQTIIKNGFFFNNGFVFDVAIGFGVRYDYSQTNYSNQLSTFNERSLLYPYNKIYQYGSKWFPSVNGSFKIGHAF